MIEHLLIMIVVWRWCNIFYSCMMWIVIKRWLCKFCECWFKIFRMLWRCVILWRCSVLFDYWCDNFLMMWRSIVFWRCWNNVGLRCKVFNGRWWDRCNSFDHLWFKHFSNDLHVSWFTPNDSIESIVIVGSVFDDSFETFECKLNMKINTN